uniref:uncharacterized protein LOC124059956 isoform X1 n=1 Tax=Scatophagus argus TaxID=75038 RepID=UPI001ED7CF77|nr:uncharacterized protein LOC124059956 isoform X1 [Scatophagus argus]
MSADWWIFILALCFMCVSSNEDEYDREDCSEDLDCERQRLSARLGSTVLLSCHFSKRTPSQVLWVHMDDVIFLTSDGRVKFSNPRHGRVKVFPNQGSQGNYSICIDELQDSDLGCYRCKQGNDCLEVKLIAETGTLTEETQLLIYICAGIATILLVITGYCCLKCILWCNNRKQDNTNNPVGAVASAPPAEIGRQVDEQRRGEDNLVYENDDQCPASQQGNYSRNHGNLPGVLPDVDRTQPTQSTSSIYPNLNQFNFERVESQRTKLRFHTDILSRIRQASFSRHYYVNQRELSKQQATSTQAESHCTGGLGKKKKKKVNENCQYQNPIYNRSTEQLNHL